MRLFQFLLPLFMLLLPGLVSAANMVPNRDFKLEVSVSADDIVGFYSARYDWNTGAFVSKNSSPVTVLYGDIDLFTTFSFDSASDPYKINGSMLFTDNSIGIFTYDFATMRGVYDVGDLGSTSYRATFSFKAGGSGNLFYENDNIPTYTEEEVSFSNTKVTLTLAPVPLPAGFPMMTAVLGLLGVLGWRKSVYKVRGD